MSRDQATAYGILSAIVLFFVILAFVFTTGSSFSQRCARMFPNSPIRQDECTENLIKGLRP